MIMVQRSTILKERAMNKLAQVREHWDNKPCEARNGASFEEGTSEFFERIEEERYERQGYIRQFAEFASCRGKKVLEVGCGLGTDLLQFARAGASITGVDISAKAVGLSQRRLALYGMPGTVSQMNGERLDLPDNSFDLVYSWGVIHHSPDHEKVAKEIHRVLKPGGTLKVMVYHRLSLVSLAVYLLDVKRHGNPFVSFKTALSRSLESPGTKAFSIGEIRDLFKDFGGLKLTLRPMAECSLLKNTPLVWLPKLCPRGLVFWVMVEGVK